jgi:hypothetical protein
MKHLFLSLIHILVAAFALGQNPPANGKAVAGTPPPPAATSPAVVTGPTVVSPQAAADAAKPAPVTTPPLPAGVTIGEPSYPLPLEQRDKFRDLQHENDAIEIEDQKMQVKIEQNKARQAVIVDQEMAIASQFGREKNLDLTQYYLDPAPIALKKNKPAAK